MQRPATADLANGRPWAGQAHACGGGQARQARDRRGIQARIQMRGCGAAVCCIDGGRVRFVCVPAVHNQQQGSRAPDRLQPYLVVEPAAR